MKLNVGFIKLYKTNSSMQTNVILRWLHGVTEHKTVRFYNPLRPNLTG